MRGRVVEMVQAVGVQIGQTIGHYRLVSLLGQGGMGAVYLAERCDELNMQVALKVLTRTGDAMAAQRFARERQLLARLKHAHIAQIVDGGETADQRLWFAMEYVEGQTLDAHLAQHKLSLEDKLRLFLKICSAVSYAHQNFVIHRDLKPGNIMVDGQGEPRLLDFGVAGLLAQDEEAATVTLVGRAFTPQYASPEQMRGEPLGAASDVYALGMIFYEMISGVQPYVLQGQSPQMALALICEKPVTRPSDALTTGSDSESQQLRNKLRGDLDVIATKALAKLPDERYASVESLMQDIENYLGFRPISAREPTLTYRLRKLVSRNRRTVVLLSSVIVLLLVALGYSLKQQQIAERERLLAQQESERAREQETIAKEGIEFLNTILVDQARNISIDDHERVFELLIKAKHEVVERFEDYPGVGIDVYLNIVSAVSAIGRNFEACLLASEMPFDVNELDDEFEKTRVVMLLIKKMYNCEAYQEISKLLEHVKVDVFFNMKGDEILESIYMMIVLYDKAGLEISDEVIQRIDAELIVRNNPFSDRVQFVSLLERMGFGQSYLLRELDGVVERFSGDNSEIPLRGVKEVVRLYAELGAKDRAYCFVNRLEDVLGFNFEKCKKFICFRMKVALSNLDNGLKVNPDDLNSVLKYHEFKKQVKLYSGYRSFYLSAVYFYAQGDLISLGVVNENYVNAMVESKVENNIHEAVLIQGMAWQYVLEGETERLVELMESALANPDWLAEFKADFKVYLAKGYFLRGEKERALPLLKEAAEYQLKKRKGYRMSNRIVIRDLNEMLAEVGIPLVEI